jgi:long-chain acyl-CoA synthetase
VGGEIDMKQSEGFLAGPEAAFGVGMMLALNAKLAPRRTAVVSERGDRTFDELNGRANQLVRALRARGLQAGDAVVLMCSNRPEFIEVYAAALRAGFRLSCINWHLQADELAYIVEDCQARAFIAEDRAAPVASEIAARPPRALVKLGIGRSNVGFEDYEAALAPEPAHDIDDPTLGRTMQYTSGTTGRPKGVHHRPRIAPATSVMAGMVRWDGGESLSLCTGPLYHAAPLAYSMAVPLYHGVGTVLMDRWDAEQTLQLITRHRVTHTHMVATMFHRLLALPAAVRQRYDLSSLRYVLHGAAPTPVHVKQAMMDWLGPIIYEYYAGTEGGGTAITPEEWLKKPGSVGRPTPGRQVEILDDSARTLPAGQVGNVYFAVPEFGGFEYFNDPEKTAAAYRGDRFTLGDHGYLDDDGYLFLTGRTSEVIISGGVNIYPAEVDAVLLMHPDVVDAATVGVPNDEFGEEVKGVVVVGRADRAGDRLAQELIEFCRARLAHFKCPRSIDFVTEVPRSEAGKVQRRRVREPYWQGRGRSM